MQDSLSQKEIELLEWLLPLDRPFYHNLHQRILATGITARRDDQIILGDFDESFSETLALGEISTSSGTEPISIQGTDDLTSFSLNFPQETGHAHWTYSTWRPHTSSPKGNPVREIEVFRQNEVKYVFALSPAERVLWLHHIDSGNNQLLPVTGIFVELARLRGKIQAARLSHEAFFTMTDEASDTELAEALINYNKRAKKFDSEGITTVKEKRRGLLSFFDRIRR